MLKKLFNLSILIFLCNPIWSQTFGNFIFSNLPQDYQLFPRNASNVANLTIQAKTSSSNSLGLFIYRNKQLNQVLKPKSVAGVFAFNFTIPAELVEYDLTFFTYNGLDSTQLLQRTNIVAGDVILVTGQSNAKLGPMDRNVYQGEFLRTFGKNNLIQDLTKSYTLSDTLWNTQKLNLNLDPIAADYQGLGLGPFASELGKIIIESEKIPVAIISNAQPSTTIDFHLNMNGDLKSPKGSDILYYKTLKAGLINDVKAIVFIQGETEIISNVANTWIDKFNQLKSKWKTYFPNVQKVAVPQLNIYSFKSTNSAWLRNEQRKLVTQNDIISWATVGNVGFDGLHYFGTKYLKNPNDLFQYENQGYFQLAKEVGRLLLKDIYKKNSSIQVQSPNIQKAYFPDADSRNKVVLEFEEGQMLKITKDTTVIDFKATAVKHELKNNFFYDKYNQSSMGPYITNISTDGKNKIILEFNVFYEGNTISYLPEIHGNIESNAYPFPGPFITNQFGMRAFAFSNIIIEEKTIYSDEFNLFPNPSNDWIELRWPSVVNGNIIVYDILGKPIYSRIISNTRIVNINLLDFGIKTGKYFIKFINEKGGIASKSFIKL
jgi:hypothetical protein